VKKPTTPEYFSGYLIELGNQVKKGSTILYSESGALYIDEYFDIGKRYLWKSGSVLDV
jgi:hypothetical protein